MSIHAKGSIGLNMDLPNGKIISLIVDNLFKNVLTHDKIEFAQSFNNLSLEFGLKMIFRKWRFRGDIKHFIFNMF